MSFYVCLIVGRNAQLLGFTNFHCGTDAEASDLAVRYAGRVGTNEARIELWDGRRSVPVAELAEV